MLESHHEGQRERPDEVVVLLDREAPCVAQAAGNAAEERRVIGDVQQHLAGAKRVRPAHGQQQAD
jgi:hypothetical protein